MAKKEKAPAKPVVLVVKGKIYKMIKATGLRVGGDFCSALSAKVEASVNASIQKVQADGKKKTLNAEDVSAL